MPDMASPNGLGRFAKTSRRGVMAASLDSQKPAWRSHCSEAASGDRRAGL